MLPVLVCAALACIGATSNGQSLKADSQLFDKPNGAGHGVALPAGTPLKVMEREGFWVRVEGTGKVGWLKASGLSFSTTASGTTTIDTGRLGKGNIVSTSATRGLSAQDLLNGSPRPEQVVSMARQVPDAVAVQGFQSEGALQQPSRKVALRPIAPVAIVSPVGAGQLRGGNGSPSASKNEKKVGDEW